MLTPIFSRLHSSSQAQNFGISDLVFDGGLSEPLGSFYLDGNAKTQIPEESPNPTRFLSCVPKLEFQVCFAGSFPADHETSPSDSEEYENNPQYVFFVDGPNPVNCFCSLEIVGESTTSEQNPGVALALEAYSVHGAEYDEADDPRVFWMPAFQAFPMVKTSESSLVSSRFVANPEHVVTLVPTAPRFRGKPFLLRIASNSRLTVEDMGDVEDFADSSDDDANY